MRTSFTIAVLLATSLVAEAQTSQQSQKVSSAEETAARYGRVTTPRTAPRRTTTTTPISIGVGSQKKVSYGRSSSYGHDRTSGRSNALSIGIAVGNALVGAPIATASRAPLMGGMGSSSAEAQAYRQGYERERERMQREREREAERIGRTDARAGVWNPRFATPGERTAYERGYNREQERIRREREREAERAGREAARDQSGWGW